MDIDQESEAKAEFLWKHVCSQSLDVSLAGNAIQPETGVGGLNGM